MDSRSLFSLAQNSIYNVSFYYYYYYYYYDYYYVNKNHVKRKIHA